MLWENIYSLCSDVINLFLSGDEAAYAAAVSSLNLSVFCYIILVRQHKPKL